MRKVCQTDDFRKQPFFYCAIALRLYGISSRPKFMLLISRKLHDCIHERLILSSIFSPRTLESGDISEKMAFENKIRHALRDNKLFYYTTRFHKCSLHNKEIQKE